jgi:hypothetical protein
MKIIRCASCSIQFGLDDDLYQQRMKDGDGFSCPNGHTNVFTESEVGKLNKEIERLQKIVEYYKGRMNALQDEVNYWRRAAFGYKGQWMKVKKNATGANNAETE